MRLFSGNLPLMATKGGKRFHYLCADLAKQYGPIFTLNIGPLPFVIVTGYEAVKECLSELSEATVSKQNAVYMSQ